MNDAINNSKLQIREVVINPINMDLKQKLKKNIFQKELIKKLLN